MKDKKVIVRTSSKFYDRVKKQVAKEERTMSDLIRQLLNEYLEKKNG